MLLAYLLELMVEVGQKFIIDDRRGVPIDDLVIGCHKL